MCEKCDKTKELIYSWLNQKNHECYPEIFEKIANIQDIEIIYNPVNLTKENFDNKFQDEIVFIKDSDFTVNSYSFSGYFISFIFFVIFLVTKLEPLVYIAILSLMFGMISTLVKR